MTDAADVATAAVWDTCRHTTWAWIRIWAAWADACWRNVS